MVSKSRPSHKDRATTVVSRLMGLGIRPLPVDRHDRATHEADWNKKGGDSRIQDFTARARFVWKLADPRQAKVGEGYNFGVHNESSHTAVLDPDHPLAWDAIAAGVAALGLTIEPDDSQWVWRSPRGEKRLYRSTGIKKTTKLVAKIDGALQTIFEIRVTGYDVLPGSTRLMPDGSTFDVEWLEGEPVNSPSRPPKWLVGLSKALADNNRKVIRAMTEAVGGDPEMIGRFSPVQDGYPPALAHPVLERMFVNKRFSVPDLLEQAGYESVGNRWRPAGSSHAPGIYPPSKPGNLWNCSHESDPLSGIFDSWRIFVELGHDGDIGAAVKVVKRMQKEAALEGAAKAGGVPPLQGQDDTDEPEEEEPSVASTGGIGIELTDLLSREFPPPEFLLKGDGFCLPTGVTMVVGREKSGKTMFAASVALSTVYDNALPVLGAKVVPKNQGSVLYINLDDASLTRGQRMFAAQYAAQKLEPHEGRWLRYVTSRDVEGIRGDDMVAMIADAIDEYPNLRLVIIDTYGAWRDAARSTGAYQQEREELASLQKLFSKTSDRACMILHHSNKMKFDPLDPFASVGGTVAVSGTVDNLLVFYAPTTETEYAPNEEQVIHAAIYQKGRDVENWAGYCTYRNSRGWTVEGSAPEVLHVGIRNDIVTVMMDDPDRVWPSTDILNALKNAGVYDGTRGSFRQILHRMTLSRYGRAVLVSVRGRAGGFKIADWMRGGRNGQ